ncbi:hypothetical protein EVAR_47826_1 [Eumeta japonica]|uniref:Uncharacterized protein n=1 Tax=Eumeta variegata TaxID=151549 RepID=A0A4C1YZU5_EUMVA|nr:hypothetical protein EVAR_47826_1 [Eumeta japonica]
MYAAYFFVNQLLQNCFEHSRASAGAGRGAGGGRPEAGVIFQHRTAPARAGIRNIRRCANSGCLSKSTQETWTLGRISERIRHNEPIELGEPRAPRPAPPAPHLRPGN